MRIVQRPLPGVLVLEPRVLGDERGFFFESFHQSRWEALTGLSTRFVQDNHSRSGRGVLRGLHYQLRQPQGKLVRVVVGEVFDVAVDLRGNSPTFGRWCGVGVSCENRRQVWIPPGFAHGFLVMSDTAELLYKATVYYAPEWERAVRWDDPELAISWPLKAKLPLLSSRDASAPLLRDAECYA